MIRFFDILFSGMALIVLSPLFLIVSLVLALTGEHEVFYLQPRVGFGGKDFYVFKFTTMVKNAEKMAGGLLTQQNDPRVLPFGSFLRKTKINELPQLLNIFLGSMSVVGPRPQARVHYELFSEDQKRYISQLKPGLTGIGSLIFRDEEGILARSPHDFDHTHDRIITPYKGELEKWYYHHRSLKNYFKIIFLTAFGILKSDLRVLHRFPDLPAVPAELRGIIG
ncbi:MAG: sugar transferase [Spirochaetaceae bacterium]